MKSLKYQWLKVFNTRLHNRFVLVHHLKRAAYKHNNICVMIITQTTKDQLQANELSLV